MCRTGIRRAPRQVKTVDHHQSQPIDQSDDGKQQRVGVRSVPADRYVRRPEQREKGDAVLRQIRTDTLFLVHLDDQQRDCGDEGGESEQQQLGVAPIGQCRCHRHHGLWLGGHAAVRQLVPGSGCVVGGLGVAAVGGGAVAAADAHTGNNDC